MTNHNATLRNETPPPHRADCLHAPLFPISAPLLLDASACRDHLARLLHPAGPRCPHCALPLPEPRHAAFFGWTRIQCPECSRWFRATTGTVLSGAKLGPRRLVLMALLLAAGAQPAVVARLAGVSANTLRAWIPRLEALHA